MIGKLANALCLHINKSLFISDICLHVDYDGFNAIVLELNNSTTYFILNVDTETKMIILNIKYFNEDLELSSEKTLKYNSFSIALPEMMRIIEDLNNETKGK